MKWRAILIFTLVMGSLCAVQAQPAGRLYDDFKGPWLDSSKWLTQPTCSATLFVDTAASINLLDCAREIRDNKLDLKVRAYGSSISDQGRQFGPAELYFTNPNAVGSMAATIQLKQLDAVGCPSNPTDSFGQTLIGGNFFNIGTGDPNDDVAAMFLAQHLASDPAGTLNLYGVIFSPNSFYGFAALGTIDLHEAFATKLLWDSAHHQFVFSVASATLHTTAPVPYAAPDGMMPIAPMKLLAARAFVPNCTTQNTFADIELQIDRVSVNQ